MIFSLSKGYNLLSHKGRGLSSLFSCTRAPERLALVAEGVLVLLNEGFDFSLDGKQPGHLSGVKGNGETSQTIHAERAFLGDFQRKRLGRVFLFLFQFRFEGRDLLLKGCEVVLIFFRVRFEVCCHDFFLSLEGVYTDYSKVGGECQGLFFIAGGRGPVLRLSRVFTCYAGSFNGVLGGRKY